MYAFSKQEQRLCIISHKQTGMPVSSGISDLWEISDLFLYVSYFASQSEKITLANKFLMSVAKMKAFG